MHPHHDTPSARAFGDLYVRYHARLVRYCSRRLGSKPDAEDAAHEALLRAFQAWSRFDPSTDAWPWLATIAQRVCADARRRSARPVIDTGEQPSADVHDQAVDRLRASIVDDALGRLPAHYRTPLVLKEYAGWSYRDIAELEGRSVASVRSTIMRGRRHLVARVEDVARTQGQWPLPAVVPRLAEQAGIRSRRHAVRAWLDRTAQTAVAVVDSSFFALGALTSPAAHTVAPAVAAAVAAASALVTGGVDARPSPPAAIAPAAPSATTRMAVQAAPPGGPPAVAVTVERGSGGSGSNVTTVAHIDDYVPENDVVGLGPVTITFQRRDDRLRVTMTNFYTWPIVGDTEEPLILQAPCLPDGVSQAACTAVDEAVEKAVDATD
ncbi:MAG TPA: sigma-70 family RNA polymerase sigma factor [Acidimicrobiales bacterium]|nr:sigma-70 family RNA polymerase sigma factor [Acidimicrobiales bacterium]